MADRLKTFQRYVKEIEVKASRKAVFGGEAAESLTKTFTRHMDNDLNTKEAFDGIYKIVSRIDIDGMKPVDASGVLNTLKKIDEVFNVIF
jgi:cysteinyl-tRNA synthetase